MYGVNLYVRVCTIPVSRELLGRLYDWILCVSGDLIVTRFVQLRGRVTDARVHVLFHFRCLGKPLSHVCIYYVT